MELWILALAAAYLSGSIPFGLVIGKGLCGVDIREQGSGNLGATNALRVLGKRVGGAVLALDAAKGALPVLLLPWALARAEASFPSWLPVALAGLAVAGHVFPLWLKFKGGKGVATSAGAVLALHPAATGIAILAFATTLLTTKIVSLSSILAALTLPLAALLLEGPQQAFGPGLPRMILFGILATLVVVRHRANLSRLLAGTEPKIGQKAAPSPASEPAEENSPSPGPPGR